MRHLASRSAQTIAIAAAFATSCPVWASGADTPGLEPAVKCAARGGLPNAANKLRRGRPVSVAFIGGSITVGGGSAHGYVTKVTEWLERNFPRSHITVANAGISGTDSNFGAKRYDRDVLAHEPDLVFIEFCVNDGDRDHTKHMERMVHKTWLSNPETDIAIFYTLAKSHLPHYKRGLLPPSASAHERVAEFYGIPSIGTGYVAAKMVNDGEISWKGFSNDGCHPHKDGFGIFNRVFVETFPELLRTGRPGRHRLGRSITPGLQVYPPEVKTVAQRIEPFVCRNGRRARESYSLPVPAVHWKGEPAFQARGGKTTWRLQYMRRVRETTPNVGLDKNAWASNEMEWFEEDRCFTGKGGSALFRPSGKDACFIGFSGKALSVITFVAPARGAYVFHVTGGHLGAWRSEDKTFGLNMSVFRWGRARGESLKSKTALKNDVKGIDWEVEVVLAAGEEVGFIPVTNASGSIRGGIWGCKVHVGRM